MLAVSHGRVDTVKMLLDVGADVNIQVQHNLRKNTDEYDTYIMKLNS